MSSSGEDDDNQTELANLFETDDDFASDDDGIA